MQMIDRGVEHASWRSPDWKAVLPGEGLGVIPVVVPSREDGRLGSLQAWDPVTQRRVWEVPLPGFWNPGTLTTASNLVFQGRADGVFVAYDATTGQQLWQMPLGLGISAPPIAYAVNGRQYLALLVGWGGVATAVGGAEAAAHGWAYGAQRRRLVAFSLEGTVELSPQPAPVVAVPIGSEDFPVNVAAATRGAAVFAARCQFCHGIGARAEVVRDGGRKPRGMPQFAEFTDQRLEDLRHYFRQQADLALAAAKPK